MPVILDTNHRLFLPGTSNVTFGKTPMPNKPALLLDVIANYLKNYMSSFRNPNFYSYYLDGDSTYISDGGQDMYDGGNYTIPWLISNTDYSTDTGNPGDNVEVDYDVVEAQLVDTNFYYTSLGYVPYGQGPQDLSCMPLTVLGSRLGTGYPIGWQVCGNSGADGGGELSSSVIYNGQSLSGFTVHAFYRETYDAGDPSHCNLFILLGHNKWGSVFGTVNSFADDVSNGSNGAYFYTSGANVKDVLAIQTLLSKEDGVEVTAAECQTVVQSFAEKIRLALSY
jgi:hypothetical protein